MIPRQLKNPAGGQISSPRLSRVKSCPPFPESHVRHQFGEGSSEYRLQADKTTLTRVNAVLPTPSPCSYAMALPFPPFPPFPDGKIAPGDKFLGRVGPAEDDPLPGRDLHPAEPGRDCITGAKNQRPGGPDPPAGS
jgi:hypothetical protein